MYTDKVQFKLKCPKHVRFNPERDGFQGVRGGCTTCLALCEVYDTVNKLRKAVRAADQLTGEESDGSNN
jgi:hypothetical protein